MKKKPQKPPTKQRVVNVGGAALARETGFSPAAISKKLKQGRTPDQIRKEAARRQGRVYGPGTPPKTKSEYELVAETRDRYDALEDAKLRRAKALAERQEIENMLRRGELMPVAYARKWATRFLVDGRDELLTGPSQLADALAAESDAVKVEAILRAWIERAIAKFEQLKQLWEGGLDAERVA